MNTIYRNNYEILQDLFQDFRDRVEKKNFQLSNLWQKFNTFANVRYTLAYLTQEEVDYLKRVIDHKVYVFNAGIELAKLPYFFQSFNSGQQAQYIENLIQHDLSKFTYLEMHGYAHHDFKSKEEDLYFEHAWHHHKVNNPHHPEYWLSVDRGGKVTPLVMGTYYIFEMVADWIGAGKSYGNELESWLPDNIGKFLFHPETVLILDLILRQYGIDTTNFEYKTTQA